MEENLKEYADIKSNLQQILSVVLVANKVEKSEQAEKEEDEEEGEDALADEVHLLIHFFVLLTCLIVND